jgi:hypothetical protein
MHCRQSALSAKPSFNPLPQRKRKQIRAHPNDKNAFANVRPLRSLTPPRSEDNFISLLQFLQLGFGHSRFGFSDSAYGCSQFSALYFNGSVARGTVCGAISYLEN